MRRNLDLIFSRQFERTVDRDNTVAFHNLILQIEPAEWRGAMAGCKVIIHQHLDATLILAISTSLLRACPRVRRSSTVEHPPACCPT